MEILAVYIPKPGEFWASIGLLAIAYLVLCACAYPMKLSVPIAALVMAAGGGLAIAPDLYYAWHSHGYSGITARSMSGTDYSDAFFEITAYLYVGRGKILCVLGMGAALVLYAVIVDFRARIQRRRIEEAQARPST